MQIDINKLPTEVESLHKIIATLHEKNNEWSSKCRKLSTDNIELLNQIKN